MFPVLAFLVIWLGVMAGASLYGRHRHISSNCFLCHRRPSALYEFHGSWVCHHCLNRYRNTSTQEGTH